MELGKKPAQRSLLKDVHKLLGQSCREETKERPGVRLKSWRSPASRGLRSEGEWGRLVEWELVDKGVPAA